MNLQDILRVKGSHVHSIGPEATLDDVVQALVKHNCGSLLVCTASTGGSSKTIGIITERDILRACAAKKAPLDQLHVQDVMSRSLITGSPDDTIEQTMGVMTQRRIRHLPVMEADCLCGLVSIGDVVKAQHQQMELENHLLKSYIQGQ